MQHLVTLDAATDLEGWRTNARTLIHLRVAPADVDFVMRDATRLPIVDDAMPLTPSLLDATASPFRVKRSFMALCETIVLHRNPAKFGLMYRLLWRLQEQPDLLSDPLDDDVLLATAMRKSIRRDMHKMTAFVRFREVGESADPDAETPERIVANRVEPAHETRRWFVAWFEPDHYIVEATAPFFTKRFAGMCWSIITPDASAHWDMQRLRIGLGAGRDSVPHDDVTDDLWRTYYASIFNPARLMIKAMQKEMPKKYWKNLPEASLITPLIQSASLRERSMLAQADASQIKSPKRRIPVRAEAPSQSRPPPYPERGFDEQSAATTLSETHARARECRECPLWEQATQTVVGVGPVNARIMLVGEQPGDREDLEGLPFIGPAGQLLDRALAQAGISRTALYVTNAVKHFKFITRGKRRMHQSPKVIEIQACNHWLADEIRLLAPTHIVALGATAAHALLGRATPVEKNRSRWMPLGAAQLLITVHPSFLLRLEDPAVRRAEETRFVDDLRLLQSVIATKTE